MSNYPRKIQLAPNAFMIARSEDAFNLYAQADEAVLSKADLKEMAAAITKEIGSKDSKESKNSLGHTSLDEAIEKAGSKAPKKAAEAPEPKEPAKTKAEDKTPEKGADSKGSGGKKK